MHGNLGPCHWSNNRSYTHILEATLGMLVLLKCLVKCLLVEVHYLCKNCSSGKASRKTCIKTNTWQVQTLQRVINIMILYIFSISYKK